MQIVKKDDFVTLPNGLKWRRPDTNDYKEAERITREQEALYDQFCKLGTSELDDGRAQVIKRQVARLENQKHPCLRVWNAHLFPEEQKKVQGLMI